MEVRFDSKGPSHVRKTVASNSIGYGAILRPNSAGELIEASVVDVPDGLGLFVALEPGTGVRNVLRWGSDSVTNSLWSWTPGQALYLSTIPGELSHSGTVGKEVGYAESATTIVFGPTPISPYVDAVITISHTGSTFEAIIDVDPGATIEWRFTDSTTDNTAHPVKDFGSQASRQTELVVTPWSALNLLDLGYDAGDNGDLGAQYLLGGQNVTAIDGLAYATGLQVFAASNNPIVSIDFTNCASLQKIECLSCTSLQSVNLTGTINLLRICFEASALQTLDVSDCVSLTDFRAGGNGINGINWGSIGSALRHICIWGNTDISLPAMTRFTALEELLIWESNVSGSLLFASSSLAIMDMHTNQITSVDVSSGFLNGAAGTLNISGNLLASLNIAGCPEILDLDISNNLLVAATLDDILAVMDLYGTSNGTIDASGNEEPTAAGLASAASLESRSWSVTLTSSYVLQDLFDRADTTVLDNGWVGRDAGGRITSNALVSDASGYNIIYNESLGALPADHYIEWTIPHSRLSDNFWGIATHINTTDFHGCGLFFLTDPASPIICDTFEAGGAPTSSITVTGGFPASWSVDQDHTIGLEVIGTSWRILLDRAEYGTFTRTQSGTAIGIIGEGGKNWLDVTVYNSVP